MYYDPNMFPITINGNLIGYFVNKNNRIYNARTLRKILKEAYVKVPIVSEFKCQYKYTQNYIKSLMKLAEDILSYKINCCTFEFNNFDIWCTNRSIIFHKCREIMKGNI